MLFAFAAHASETPYHLVHYGLSLFLLFLGGLFFWKGSQSGRNWMMYLQYGLGIAQPSLLLAGYPIEQAYDIIILTFLHFALAIFLKKSLIPKSHAN
ncbi:hypothetical protein KFE98_10650 [bacterium SCSIO 12741]|nr:hypothetical protein KFE98_10650 [bacterium SCSIO 12741]